MGETFNTVMEIENYEGLREKIEILSDFHIILKILKIDLERSNYVLVITKSDENEIDWEDRLSSMKAAMLGTVEETVNEKIESLNQKIETVRQMTENTN